SFECMQSPDCPHIHSCPASGPSGEVQRGAESDSVSAVSRPQDLSTWTVPVEDRPLIPVFYQRSFRSRKRIVRLLDSSIRIRCAGPFCLFPATAPTSSARSPEQNCSSRPCTVVCLDWRSSSQQFRKSSRNLPNARVATCRQSPSRRSPTILRFLQPHLPPSPGLHTARRKTHTACRRSE